ncbi:MAG: helix-turn-helix transcriptional regulator [Pseudomonadota bacterium]
MTVEFGSALKDWRRQRRQSQLDLALNAGVSARHISFLETGRSRPSRGMVLRLCDELEIPRSVRNHLLTCAGHSPAYESRRMDETEMTPVRLAVEWTLSRHDPYPAFALDRHWSIVNLNHSAAGLFGGLGLGQGDNLLSALSTNKAVQRSIVNLDEVLRHVIARLRTESAHFGGDPVLESAAHDMLMALKSPGDAPTGLRPAFVPARYRVGDLELSFLTTLSQFGTAEDILLSELRVELMYPADESTRLALEALAQS